MRRLAVLLIASVIAVPAGAQVSLSGNTLSVVTPDLSAVFQGAALVSLQNLTTGIECIAQPGPAWFSLNMLDPINRAMSPGQWQLVADPVSNSTAGVITYSDDTRTATLTVGIDPSSGEMFLRVSGSSSDPGVQSVFWGMFGFRLDDPARLIIPGQAGEYYDRHSVTELVGVDYPTHWESQFAIYQAAQGSVLMYAHDTTPRYKRLQASRLSGNLDFGFEMFADAPWPSAQSTAEFEWRMKGFADDWKQGADYYKSWWAAAGPQNANPAPAWTRNIRAEVAIMYLDQPALQALAQTLDPTKTLLYLVPWRASGYDLNYPDYTPAEGCAEYIQLAHQLGFHVMLHVSALGVSETNPNYPAMQPYQMLTANSLAPVGWLLNLDPGDIHRIAYISPAYDGYRKLLIDSIRPAIESLQPDAIHLDAGGEIINDGNGPVQGMNSVQGMVRLQQDLRAAFPDLALGYESITDVNFQFVSFAERWSENVSPHPISTYFFGDKVFFYGFRDQPNPQQTQFITYLQHYEGQGILPTIQVASVLDFDPTRLELSRTLRQIRMWQDREFVPDWGSDWSGATFQWVSLADGGAARVETSPDGVALKVDGQTFYQRVTNSATYQTSDFIPNWPAWDSNSLYGLDPSSQYWLEPSLARPSGLPHLGGVPSAIRVDSGTFMDPAFALVTMAVNNPPSYDFVGNFSVARKGTYYPGLNRDRGLLFGALAQITPVYVGGKVADSTIVMQPPFQHPAIWGGVTYVEYTVTLPDTTTVQLSFQVALADSTQRKDPDTFVVWVNGKEVWRAWAGTGNWVPGTVDLSSMRGETVTIRLITAPGPHNNPLYALGCWSDVTISTNITQPASQFNLSLPGAGTASFFGASGQSIGANASDGSSVYNVTMDVPGTMLMFVNPPPQVQSGSDLLDLPFSRFISYYSDLPQPYTVTQNASIINNPGLGGATLDRAIFTNPEHNSRIFLSWPITLPQNASTLTFNYGLMDPLPDYGNITIPYSGVDVFVYINGQQQFDDDVQTGGARSGSVDISKWAGQPVVLQFAIDADGTAIYDWALLNKLLIN